MKTKETLNNNQKKVLHEGVTEIMQRANKIGDLIFNKEELEYARGEIIILESKIIELRNFLEDALESVESAKTKKNKKVVNVKKDLDENNGNI